MKYVVVYQTVNSDKINSFYRLKVFVDRVDAINYYMESVVEHVTNAMTHKNNNEYIERIVVNYQINKNCFATIQQSGFKRPVSVIIARFDEDEDICFNAMVPVVNVCNCGNICACNLSDSVHHCDCECVDACEQTQNVGDIVDLL